MRRPSHLAQIQLSREVFWQAAKNFEKIFRDREPRRRDIAGSRCERDARRARLHRTLSCDDTTTRVVMRAIERLSDAMRDD